MMPGVPFGVAVIAAALLLLSASALPVGAQPDAAETADPVAALLTPGGVQRYGAWLVTCRSAAAQAAPACVMSPAEPVSDMVGEPLGVTLALTAPDGGETAVVAFRVPLGTPLQHGIQLSIDGEFLGKMEFQFCNATGCVAAAVLAGRLAERFRLGSRLTLKLQRPGGRPAASEISLTGSMKALAALQESLGG